jgi:hypothetical protein
LCEGISGVDKVVDAVDPLRVPLDATVLAPPVEARAFVGEALIQQSSCKSGRVKVVDPFPAP